MLGWGVAVGGCGGRCLNQDLRDLGIFGIRATHWRSGWSGWQEGVSSWGVRCLKQDLQDFVDLQDGGRTGGVDGRVGMGRGRGWLRRALEGVSSWGVRCLNQDLRDFVDFRD